MKKAFIVSVAALLLAGFTAVAQNVQVAFDSMGGSEVSALTVKAGDKIQAPAHPVKDGFVFVGWYTDPTASLNMWDFRNSTVPGNITLHAKWVKVDAMHLLLNAYATAEELKSPYVANNLRDLGPYDEQSRTLTLQDGTTVYIAPGVYWTDTTYRQGFPFDNSGFVIPGPNVGLQVAGSGVSFIGLTANADDVRIAGNRGEGGAKGLGASGSWYTLAISTNFYGENITIANYAQEDLVYPRDPSQNISKRIDSKNHAEVLRGLGRNLDKMHFENVRFVGYLNMMAGFSPRRSYFHNCFIQCTDDSIFDGTMNVYENCTFHFVDNHPTWSSASAGGINAILGCKMVGMPQMTHPMLSFAKDAAGTDGVSATGIYGIIDCEFTGRIQTVEWENKVSDYSRYAVHNNTIGDDKKPLVISAAHPELSVDYSGDALLAFKVGDEYNVYNLLKGDDGWDPKGQYTADWAPYANLPYRFLVGQSGRDLQSSMTGEKNTVILTPAPIPASSVDLSKVVWNYDKEKLNAKMDPKTGVLTVNAKPNNTGTVQKVYVECVLPNGIPAGVNLNIYPVPVAAPVLKSPAIKVGKGVAALSYKLDNASYKDVSMIEWYRESSANSTNGVHIGTMRNDEAGLYVDEPFKNYPLSKYDVGCYLRAVITPKYEFSANGAQPVTVYTTRAITEKDVVEQGVYTNFKNEYIVAEDVTTVGRWFFECQDAQMPWGWGVGTNGADGLWGLQNNNRGRFPSRLLYGQSGEYHDMSLTLNYSPGKVEGQGFGGSGCYMDIYVKFDPVTRSGYGLRIERVPATTNGTKWTLYKYDGDDNQTALTEGILTACFMPQSTLTVSVKGNTLTATASTKSIKTPLQIKENLPEKIEISWTDKSGALAKNTKGSFGFRMNNSGTSSYAVNAMTNNSVMMHEVKVEY